ncbi:MAG: hypothetical protein Kow0042_12760 [Calditrichia bacterium]
MFALMIDVIEKLMKAEFTQMISLQGILAAKWTFYLLVSWPQEPIVPDYRSVAEQIRKQRVINL